MVTKIPHNIGKVFKNKKRQHQTRHNVTPHKIQNTAVNKPIKTKRGGVSTGKYARPADQTDPFAFYSGPTTASKDIAHKIRNTVPLAYSSVGEWKGVSTSNIGNRVHRTTLREPVPTEHDWATGTKYYRPTAAALNHQTMPHGPGMTDRMSGVTNQPYQKGYLYEFHGDGTYTRHRDAEYHIDMMSGENV